LADCEEESDEPIQPIRDSVEDRHHPLSTYNESSRRPDGSHRVPSDSRLASLSSDGEVSRQSSHPEVHWVCDDSPVAGPPSIPVSPSPVPPIPVPTATQPTTAECPASLFLLPMQMAFPRSTYSWLRFLAQKDAIISEKDGQIQVQVTTNLPE